MGQPISVTVREGAHAGVRFFEANRSITGMAIETYLSAAGATGARPPDVLAVLGATAVAIAGLGYWLLTQGILGQWLARRAHLTPNGVLCGGAIVAALASGAGLVFLRMQDQRAHSALAQFNLRAIATATR